MAATSVSQQKLVKGKGLYARVSITSSATYVRTYSSQCLATSFVRMYTLPVLHAVSRTNTIAVTLFSRRLLCCPQYHPVSSHLYLHPLLVQLTTDLLSSPDSLQTHTQIYTYIDRHSSVRLCQPPPLVAQSSFCSLYQVRICTYFTHLSVNSVPWCARHLIGTCCLYMTIQVHTYIRTFILYVIHNTTLYIHMYSVVGRSLAAGVSIRPLHHLLRCIPPRQCIKAVVWPTCATVVYTYTVLSNE